MKKLAIVLLLATVANASDVSWTRFRGKVKTVNYRASTMTIESNGDLVTIKVDDDVTILAGKEKQPLSAIGIDDKVTLLYAPKAAERKDSDEPAPGSVYAPLKR
jgi:hypothetical protein